MTKAASAGAGAEVASGENLLDVRNLRKTYAHAGGRFVQVAGATNGPRAVAVDDVSFSLARGESLGIVGESGCGKTTLARMLLRLIEPDAGSVRFDGHDWLAVKGAELRRMRRGMQMVFQDPMASLNPRMRIGEIVGEPLAIHEAGLARAERTRRVDEMLDQVGLNASVAARHPHEFSGGQRQRIGIARALILRPKLVIGDEPVSALDVSVGAQILELLARLQREMQLTLILISHSVPVVAQLCSRVAVMQKGRFVETGTVDEVLNAPKDAYTQNLLAAVPQIPAENIS